METPARPRKLSKNDRIVFDVIAAQALGQHAAAHEIHARAKLRQPAIGTSTVYRALERLCGDGLVHEVRVPGSSTALYEAARRGHAHFQCARCSSIADIEYDVPSSHLAQLSAAHGIVITDVALTFRGLCRVCQDLAA